MPFRNSWEADGLARGLEQDLAEAVTASVRAGTEILKAEVREETAAAFSLSHRLPKAWRSSVFPRSGSSVDASGWVAVRNTAADIIQSAIQATTIFARGGKWLAIPTPDAGRFGLRAGRQGSGATTGGRGNRERITPAGFERRTGMKLRFVPDNGRRAFLIADAAQLTRGLIAPYRSRGRGSRLYGPAGKSIVAFVLVRSVQTRKRMDLDAAGARAAAQTAGLIVNYRRS
jgi:Family of unknown function (DUF6441)